MDDGRLVWPNLPDHMGAARIDVRHRHVSVAEHAPTGDMATLGLHLEGIPGPLTGLRALELGREVRDGHHQLVHRVVEADLLSTVGILEDPDARDADLLQDVVRLELLTPEPVLVRDNQDLERMTRLERIQQSHEAWTAVELRARGGIIDIDMLGQDLEAAMSRARLRELDLSMDVFYVVKNGTPAGAGDEAIVGVQ